MIKTTNSSLFTDRGHRPLMTFNNHGVPDTIVYSSMPLPLLAPSHIHTVSLFNTQPLSMPLTKPILV